MAPLGKAFYEGVTGLIDKGDVIVYPHHGPMEVTARKKIKAFGETKEYVTLISVDGGLSVQVPVDSLEEVGIRWLLPPDELGDLLAVLGKRGMKQSQNWSRRFKNHTEMLNSGDPYQVAEVVRNLSLRNQDKGLSAAEKTLHANSMKYLSSELQITLGRSEEDVLAMIHDATRLEEANA